ncbi:terminase family protein [Sutterella sp.]|uniref:terminase large subunit domain-containing protein n=1 Tax=Sutterella sp. TaxID=1981025 RepID=UPI0026DF6E24|nr:terminase family protein [Sutterella sp.]MDO5531055.1 terminase family protein [Sutterella sp.]
MPRIVIPYTPRYPQDVIHKELERHRFVVLVAHRRMGKTVLAVNHLIKMALKSRRREPRFGYVAPFRVQAKQIAWSYLKHYTSVVPGRSINETDLEITLPNNARIRIFGADNPDALRGLYFDGAILDEVAQMKPEVWGEIIRPALADRKGWATFIGTPKGVNLFSDLYDRALRLQDKPADPDDPESKPEWKAMLYSIEQTNALDAKEIASLKEEMSESEFRQEFLCDFNAAADDALISIDVVRAAAGRQIDATTYMHAPRVMGVDVARFGSDNSVIFKRQGLVAFEPIIIRGKDNMEVADRVAIEIASFRPDAVFVDAGEGAGVIDRLRQLRIDVVEVPFGGAANRKTVYANRRMEMWDEMRKWLESGAAIPPDPALQADLSAPTYGFTQRGLRILEAKDKIKERIGRSPDRADALALTFAAPVRPRLEPRFERQIHGDDGSNYDPMAAFEVEWGQR